MPEITLTQNTIYLMAFCFLIGSLTTLLIMAALDMVRAAHESNAEEEESDILDEKNSE